MYRASRNILRLLRIARTLARHDVLFPLEQLQVAPWIVSTARLISRRKAPGRPGERLAAAFQALGPSFIKAGQSLATRADLLSTEVAEDLSMLQDRLPPFSGSEARAIIEAQFGQPVEELFTHFEDEPIAAASIAQVHFARVAATEPDGEEREVAVKVLRPGIEEAFRKDLDLFYWVAHLIERNLPEVRRLKPVAVVETFAETVAVEMDLRLEAAAASELAQNFTGDPGFRVPAVDWERTSRRVLTTERISGIRIDERDTLAAAGQDLDGILENAATAFFNQVFRDGFFHADQHPGNIFIAEDGALQVVDFGIMGRLDRKTRFYLADMLLGFLNRDYARVADVHFEAGYVPARKSRDAFTQALRAVGEPILGKPLSEISLGRLLGQLFQTTETFEMETQPQLLLLQKTMMVAEGVGRSLNPDINMWELARPLIEDWMRENRGPEARIAEAAEDAADVLRRMPHFLANAGAAAEMLAEGGLRLHPDTVKALTREGAGPNPLVWPLWAVAIALLLLGLVVVL